MCIYINVCVYRYMSIDICIYIYMYVYRHICVYKFIFVYIYIHVMYVNRKVCMYVYIRASTMTQHALLEDYGPASQTCG